MHLKKIFDVPNPLFEVSKKKIFDVPNPLFEVSKKKYLMFLNLICCF